MLHEGPLRFFAPEILHERINYGPPGGRYTPINDDRRVFAENRRPRDHDLDRSSRLFHQESFQFVGNQRITEAGFKLCARLTRRARCGNYVSPNGRNVCRERA